MGEAGQCQGHWGHRSSAAWPAPRLGPFPSSELQRLAAIVSTLSSCNKFLTSEGQRLPSSLEDKPFAFCLANFWSTKILIIYFLCPFLQGCCARPLFLWLNHEWILFKKWWLHALCVKRHSLLIYTAGATGLTANSMRKKHDGNQHFLHLSSEFTTILSAFGPVIRLKKL